MELADHTGEIARLEALLGGDPGGPAFAALAEANRRAGRLEEAERVAREGLLRRPGEIAGRVALALALIDRGRLSEARAELERVLREVPDHPLARAATEASRDLDASLDELDDRELDGAFASAEPDLDEMVDANAVAARALRDAELDEPEGFVPEPGSPFATRTVAELLARQGHEADAAALRRKLEAPGDTGGRDRERVLATLERWLENVRRLRR